MRHEYFSDVATEKFRTTIFGMHTGSIGKQVDHDDTPQKSTKFKKKNRGEQQMNDEEVNSLPPIHQLRLDVKLNLYGATTKTQENVFKKTIASINKRKQETFMLGGINGKKMDR